MRHAARGGCYFQFDGVPALYRGGCLHSTRFAFPTISTPGPKARRSGPIRWRKCSGSWPAAAVVQVSQSAPEDLYLPNRATRAVLMQALARDYPLGEVMLGNERYALYRPR
jgi:hypothetical protein